MNDAATTCDHVRPELSAYIDGELPADEAARVERHLRGCGDCRAEEAALRSLAAELTALPRMRAPRDLAASVRDNGGAMRGEAGENMAVRDLNQRARRYLVFAQVMASAALVVLCVTVAWRLMDSWGETAVGTLATRSDFETPVERRLSPEAAAPVASAPDGGVSRETVRRSVDRRNEAGGGGFAAAPTPAANEPLDRLAGASGEPAAPTVGGAITAGAPLALGYETPEPTVHVVVTAQTMEQFNNAIAIVQNAAPQGVRQQDELSAGQLFADDEDMSASPLDAGRGGMLLAFAQQPPAPTKLELQVPPEQVWPLINSLEQNAPRQLAVEMNFRGDDAMRLQNAPADLGLPVVADKAAPGDAGAAEEARDAQPRSRHELAERTARGGEARGVERTRAGRSVEEAPGRPQGDAAREHADGDDTRKRAQAESPRENAPAVTQSRARHIATKRDDQANAGDPVQDKPALGERTAAYEFDRPATSTPATPTPRQVTFRIRVVPPPPAASQPQTSQPSQ